MFSRENRDHLLTSNGPGPRERHSHQLGRLAPRPLATPVIASGRRRGGVPEERACAAARSAPAFEQVDDDLDRSRAHYGPYPRALPSL